MFLKRICSVLLAAAVLFGCSTIGTPRMGYTAFASETLNDILEVASFGSAEGLYAFINKDRPSDRVGIEMTSENTRMFSETLKMTAPGGTTAATCYKRDFNTDVAEYAYVNMWVYSDDIPMDGDNICTLNITLYTTDLNTSYRAAYYQLPIDWDTGWKLVSIPLSEFSFRNNGSWAKGTYCHTFFIDTYATNLATKYEWPEESYVLLDDIYLSKTTPKTDAVAVTETSIENSNDNVSPDLDGENTFSFTMSRSVIESSVTDAAVTVTKGVETLDDGYSVSLDKSDRTKLNITFDSELAVGETYEIKLNKGCLYDVYGNTTESDECVLFTISQRKVFAPDADLDVLNVASFDSTVGLNNFINKTRAEDQVGLQITADNTHMFNRTLKMTAPGGTTAATCRKRDFNTDVADYNYLNLWIYSDSIPMDGDNICTLNITLYTNAPNMATGAPYYQLPIDWDTGWKLVTIPLSDFSFRNGANWSRTTYCYTFFIDTYATNLATSYQWPENSYVFLDNIYLSKNSPPIGHITVLETSVENGGDDVSPDINGKNTVSFTMSSCINENTVSTDDVMVLKGGSQMNEGFSVSVDKSDSTKLNVTFDDTLTLGETYEIRLDKGSIYDLYGNTTERDEGVQFTVSERYNLFTVIGTEPYDGEDNVLLDLGGEKVYTIRFNNPISEKAKINNCITVLKNGVKQNKGYTVSADNDVVRIYMDKSLQANTLYTIEISNELEDSYGNALTGENSFSFRTEKRLFELFAAESDESLSQLTGDNIYMTDDNARMFDKTVRIDISQAPNEQNVTIECGEVNLEEYKYANYWIYSPEAVSSSLNFIFDTDGMGSSYFRRSLNVNWEGWKLVSIPLSSFTAQGSPSWSNIAHCKINANGFIENATSWADGGYIMLDQIFLSKDKTSDFSYVGTYLPNGYSNISYKDTEITFIYSDELLSIRNDAVTIQKDGEDTDVHYETVIDGNKLNITFSEDLEPSTSYTIKIDNGLYNNAGDQPSDTVDYDFTTVSSDYGIGKPKLKAETGEEILSIPAQGTIIEAEVAVSEEFTERSGVTLTIAQYDISGKMISIDKTSDVKDDKMIVQTECMTETIAILAFIYDGEYRLLRSDYSAVGSEQNTERKIFGSNSTVGSNSLNICADLTIDELNISGKFNGSEAVMLCLKDALGNDVLIVPVYADEDGEYQYKHTFGTEHKDGVYSVNAAANGVTSKSITINYLSEKTRNELLSLVNNQNSSINDIYKMLCEYEDTFGLKGTNKANKESVARTFYEQRPFKSYLMLYDASNNAMQILDLLNNTIWSEMSNFLFKNHDIVLFDNADYKYYTSLSVKNQNTINQALNKGLPVNSFAEFRSLFSKSIQDYINSVSNTNSGNNGSGGGGSGGGGSGGGGGGKIGPLPVGTMNDFLPQNNFEEINKPTVENEQKSVFDDIDDVWWAKESIENLYTLGIISQADDKKFRPNDNITREEFVKMLVVAFGLELTDDDCGFTDASDGAWYQPYLASAKQAGIIVGNSDGSFGIGQSITRQDMAVMAYRTVKAVNKRLNNSGQEKNFTDYTEISDYALEAVNAMRAANVINGMENGTFVPLGLSTRAQAAKVISGLLNKIEGMVN